MAGKQAVDGCLMVDGPQKETAPRASSGGRSFTQQLWDFEPAACRLMPKLKDNRLTKGYRLVNRNASRSMLEQWKSPSL
jgi:hypothetical protein